MKSIERVRRMRTDTLELEVKYGSKNSRIAADAAFELRRRRERAEAARREAACGGHEWSHRYPNPYPGQVGAVIGGGQGRCIHCEAEGHLHVECCDLPHPEEVLREGDLYLFACWCGEVSEATWRKGPHRPTSRKKKSCPIGASARAYQRRDRSHR